jgi:hypothetical protein
MRTKRAVIGMLALAVSACADAPPRLAYAPPTDRPIIPAARYVRGPSADLIWGQLVDRLNQSGLQVELADPQRGVIVATYTGAATPYVTCGWIMRYGKGEPELIDASSNASFDKLVRDRPVKVDRDLRLDARLVVEVQPRGRQALVDTSGTYVLTKTIVTEGRSGRQQDRDHEIVSFTTGERGRFSKGTVCQPNGALERTVLDIMPPATRPEPAPRTPAATPPRTAIVQSEIASREPAQQPPPSSDPGTPARVSEAPAEQSAAKSVAPPPAECSSANRTYCAVLEITDPYRRANEERGLGLETERIEAGSPLLEGSDFGVDISLPDYDAYLAVTYFLRDGTVRHVLSGRDARWPAHAREFVGDSGLGEGGSGDVEMVVAMASDVPLFASPRPLEEPADSYLADLRARLAEVSRADDTARIAASLLVITPALQQPS